jgi:hypothetical protein
MQRLSNAGRAVLACYAAQQVHRFNELVEEFAMQHAETEYLAVLDEDMKTAILELFKPEELIRAIPPADRLRGLPPEDRLRGLTEEELERMRKLLARKEDE